MGTTLHAQPEAFSFRDFNKSLHNILSHSGLYKSRRLLYVRVRRSKKEHKGIEGGKWNQNWREGEKLWVLTIF